MRTLPLFHVKRWLRDDDVALDRLARIDRGDFAKNLR